jgi:membrane associated rhomboid family serine protease
MGVRRILVTIVGVVQGAIGLLAGFLACILYFNFLGVQTTLNVSTELLPLYLLILGVFSFFSVTNGFFLIHEGLE